MAAWTLRRRMLCSGFFVLISDSSFFERGVWSSHPALRTNIPGRRKSGPRRELDGGRGFATGVTAELARAFSGAGKVKRGTRKMSAMKREHMQRGGEA